MSFDENDYVHFKTARGFDYVLPRGRIPYQERSLEEHGVYEPQTEAAIYHLVKPGMTVVECGACCGYHALNLAKAVGTNGKVYCFEANPELIELLKTNLDANGFGHITDILNKGIWSEQRTLPFPLAKRGLGSIGFKSTKGIHNKGSISRWFALTLHRSRWNDIRMIEVLRLDDFLADKEVDLIRMDIEGAELQAVQGGQRVLRDRNIPIILEWTPENAILRETVVMYDLLKSLRYRVYRILEAGLTEIQSAEEFQSKHWRQCREGQRDVLCTKSPPDAW